MAATTAAVIGATAALGGVAVQANAASQARKAANNSGVDIAALDEQTRAIARRNALESAELERQLTPEVPGLRTASNMAVLGGLGPNANQDQSIAMLMARMGQTMSTPLLNDAIAKAQSDLALGGQLSLDQKNAATRGAASRTGTVTGGLGLGRDVAARDLGMTAYQVEQQRLANAGSLGGLELNREQANAGNFLSQFGALNSYYNNQRSLDLAAAQYANSIAPPVVGLDPSSVANLAIGNNNAQTQARIGAANVAGGTGQGLMGFGGGLLGYGLANGGWGTNTAATPVTNPSVMAPSTTPYTGNFLTPRF